MTGQSPQRDSYNINSQGTNSQGNQYDSRSYASAPGENAYHYSNANSSYAYKNPDSSSYYNNGKSGDGAYAQYSNPSTGNTWTQTGTGAKQYK